MSNVLLALVDRHAWARRWSACWSALIALRRTGIYFAMITVAIAEMFFFLENSPLSAWTGGENGMPGVPTPNSHLAASPGQRRHRLVDVSRSSRCASSSAWCIARRIVRSPVGAVLQRDPRQPAARARASAMRSRLYKLTAFVIAAAYAGFAGGLLGVLQGYMPPEAFTFDTSGQLVMQTVIGGAGTLFGPLVGAAVWLFLRDFLQGAVGARRVVEAGARPRVRAAGRASCGAASSAARET